MIFTIEFFRIRLNDDAHATLDRLSVIVDDLDAAKVKARSLFETLEMPQKPDGLRILDESARMTNSKKFGSRAPTISRTRSPSCMKRRRSPSWRPIR
jgi:hypothetical protein